MAWRREATAAATATFSPIPPAPIRVGEGEAPPSWDPVSTPKVMVGKGSPKLAVMARGSPKLRRFVQATSGTVKRPSPKCTGSKRSGGSSNVKQRADWNPILERSLVEILHEYKDSGYRSDNGWNTEGWNRMVKEFHLRNKSVQYTKAQIQDKEGQLKRDYKMIKAARMQSGSTWNEKRCMVEGSAAMWENLMVSFPKIKKFNNNKASFPLYDALGELYDGHLTEGTYNITSIDSHHAEEPLYKIDDAEEEEEEAPLEVYELQDEDDEENQTRVEERTKTRDEEVTKEKDVIEAIREAAGVERSGKRRKKVEKEGQRPSKTERIERLMEQLLALRTKQAEDEAAQLARENEAREKEARENEAREEAAREKEAREKDKCKDYSIKRCISIVNAMDVSKVEKAKAYKVFSKSEGNRQTFICASEDDQEAALIWLRNQMN